ncbi:unnamed protein product [Rotaria sp. Silwood2]|nr:unnamed protein product [Rotaria sp. Silwood2]
MLSLLNNCYRGPSSVCFHWREICDGINDCLNGEDEQLCELLEINQCSNNEFRCHFGEQCISSKFVDDGKMSTDYLDATDELNSKFYHRDAIDYRCHQNSIFQCEELTGSRSFTYLCPRIMTLVGTVNPILGEQLCNYYRNSQILFKMFYSLDHILNLFCREALYYLFDKFFDLYILNKPFYINHYQSLMKNCSSEWLLLPEYPVLFNFFQFVYLTNRSFNRIEEYITPDFICFNASQCSKLLFCSIDIGIDNGLNCCKRENLINKTLDYWNDLNNIFKDLIEQCSKIVDGDNDCYYKEDEQFSTCQLNDSTRFICASNFNKCLSMIAVNDGKSDCQNGEDEWPNNRRNILINKAPPIGIFCDNETNCEWWPCNNIYSRCDNQWHCLNGYDELNCPQTNCSLNEHKCYYGDYQYLCIPVDHLIEKYSNCDESYIIRKIYLNNQIYYNSMNYFLWNKTKCITSEQICLNQSLSYMKDEDVCLIETKLVPIYKMVISLIQSEDYFMCEMENNFYDKRNRKLFLKTSRLNSLPSISPVVSMKKSNQFSKTKPITTKIYKKTWYCHRGIPLLFKNNSINKCLCPPTCFGNQCQWQNQRISLTIQFLYANITNPISIFQVIIMIINEEEDIEPYHEQIIYVPKRDCTTKFNIYLLYPNRPKNNLSNYSIRIDIFDKITLTYWVSWHLSILFQFLPVNRIATQLFIPSNQQLKSCSLFCGNHGKCISYINKKILYFCQCDQRYSGNQCHIKHNCSCSSDSYCLTSSICICPIYKFGQNCYLKHSNCQLLNKSCENNGLCIPNDDRIAINSLTCLCQENFVGNKCEKNIQSRVDLEFYEDLIQRESLIFAHFITTFENSEHQSITTLYKIKYGINIITIYIKQPFHILLIEFSNHNYYLTVLREIFIQSEYIKTKIQLNTRYNSIQQIMNSTFQTYSYLHRIKYYPYFCRQYKELTCFYDENYMCLCDLDRYSNCFLFNHSIIYNCQGYNDCQNDGQCFPNNATCPSISICICSDCFYGSKCQFTTRGFVLSLDYILGYHIKPNISFTHQSSFIKVSVAITMIIFLFGIINGILSILTFRMKKTRDVGTGFYLLVSSWISICLVIVLLFKFWQLVLLQMRILTNRSFFTINCILLDGIIRILLATTDWLYGLISMERVIAAIQGVKFNKTKSKKMFRWITLSIVILIILTHIHDPLHRHLIDDIDVNEQRIWCLVGYSNSISTLISFITLVHFLIPFSINLICTIFMIYSIARSRFTIQPKLSFAEHFKLQLKQHKHRLIASFILVLLALPRLIISFINGCMKLPRNSWLYLFAYLISFFPSIITFIIYVLPSKLYKNEFNTSIQQAIRRFRHTLLLRNS